MRLRTQSVRAVWKRIGETGQAIAGALSASHHRRRGSRIVMTLLARDEADIIAATIEHALSMGVDFIIATDNGSQDGTAGILAAYRDAGVLELRHEPSRLFEQHKWVTAMARDAARRHGAAWVINSDADEFLWPTEAFEGQDLKAILGAIEPQFGQVGLFEWKFMQDWHLTGGWLDRMTLSRLGSCLDMWGYDFWKVCHRGDASVRVKSGNHLASGPRIGGIAPQRPLQIFHFRDRGYAHYMRKVSQMGEAMEGNPRLPKTWGFKIREEYQMMQRGELEAVYDLRVQESQHYIGMDYAHRDHRLRDHLHALLPRAVRPDLLKAALGA
jgi:hypothetical protein